MDLEPRPGALGRWGDRATAYDEQPAARVREVLGDRPDPSEPRMFGGSSTAIWPSPLAAERYMVLTIRPMCVK
ncbi:hypothetical protein GCM10028833_03130 [Glycomyces tarimensis]